VLVVIGVQPFELETTASAVAVTVAIGLSLSVSVVAFLKGRILPGVVGLFILPIGLFATIRLAYPRSPWARRFYPAGSRRLERAKRRFDDPGRAGVRLRHWLGNLVGGRASEPNPVLEE
jgi:hypothetical protein